VHGLRIRKRLQEQYASEASGQPAFVSNDIAPEAEAEAGGFLTEFDDIIQPFQLPKLQHYSVMGSARKLDGPSEANDEVVTEMIPTLNNHVEDDDEDMDLEPVVIPELPFNKTPRTMIQMAEEAQDQATARKVSPRLGSASQASNGTLKSQEVQQRSLRSSASRRKRPRRGSDSEPSDSDNSVRSKPLPDAAAPRRALRPRVPKSAQKIHEEREIEEAYRRAVAQ